MGNTWDTLVGAALANKFVLKRRMEDESVRSFLKDMDVSGLRGWEGGGDGVARALEEVGLVPSSTSARRGSGEIAEVELPPGSGGTAIEYLSAFLAKKYAYQEEDMVVLSHEIMAAPPSPSHGVKSSTTVAKEERFTSTLIVTGVPSSGHSAMARTVGIPLALATLEVLGVGSCGSIAGGADARNSVDRLMEATGGGGVCGGEMVWESVMRGVRVGYGGPEREGGFDFSEKREHVAETMEQMLVRS
jgi:hypothetical protein